MNNTSDSSRSARRLFSAAPSDVLVTGATGFVGRTLVRRLITDGHRVTALTRDIGKASARLGPAVTCIDSLDGLAAESGCDVVVNLAGAPIAGPRWSPARQHVLSESREGLTKRLVAWIGGRARRPRLLLSASAIGYYGVQPQGDDRPLTEDDAPGREFMSRLCVGWERAASGAADYGVAVVTMRFGVVLGKGGGSLPLLMMPIKLGVGGKLGTGRQWMSWIHREDLLGAMAHAWTLSDAAGDTLASSVTHYNFTAPQAVTQETFGRTAARIVHRPFWLHLPAAPVRLALGEQADLMVEGQRVTPARLEATGYRFMFPTLDAALSDLQKR